MKNFLLLFLFIIPTLAYSQPKIGPDNVITSPNNPGSGVIDGVYRKSDIISKRQPVAYEHVRESDYVWGKRTWSYIDLREKINHSLYDDGIKIVGGNEFIGGEFDAYDDHRIAMSVAISSIISKNKTVIKDHEVASISYKNFYKHLELLKN